MSRDREGAVGSSSRPLVGFLYLVIWFAFVTGSCEAVYVLRRRPAFDMSSNVAWMAQVSNLLWFGMLGFALWAIGRLKPGLLTPVRTIFCFGLLSFLALALMFPQLHWAAEVVIALGLAMQASRLASQRIDGFNRLVRRTTPWLVGAVVLVGVGVNLSAILKERAELAHLPAPRPGAPNVLLLVLDTVRDQDLGVYGYFRPTTPTLKHLSEQGVRFQHAWATAPWTLASHATMFTGLFPHELGIDVKKPLGTTFPTLAEKLRAHGYRTGGFVANASYGARAYGLGRGFTHYEVLLVSAGELVVSSSIGRLLADERHLRKLTGYYRVLGQMVAPEINAEFLHWVSRKDSHPYFGFLNFMEAHGIYQPPAEFDRKFAGNAPPSRYRVLNGTIFVHHLVWNYPGPLSEAQRQREIDAYDASIAYLDSEIGRLFDQLNAQGLLENTLVIVVGDHGEQIGEHGLFGHGNSVYRQLLEVPLIFSFPGKVPKGLTVAQPVSLRDLPQTVLDLVDLPDTAKLPGQTLARYWDPAVRPESVLAQPLFSELRKNYSIVAAGRHYMADKTGKELLYDIATDSNETRNLAAGADSAEVLARFRGMLNSILADSGAARRSSPPAQVGAR